LSRRSDRRAATTRSASVCALVMLFVLVGSCAPTEVAWSNPQPSRSYSDDVTRCEAEARAETLLRRGGEPRTLEERQRFATELRLGTERCVRALGWRPAHGQRSGAAIAKSAPNPRGCQLPASPDGASSAWHGRRHLDQRIADGELPFF
jgi:hypothetical protein